jgi:hypothetical protein
MCYFTLMTKHLPCKVEQWMFFLEVQGMTPITKHISILIGMQITPKWFKFIPWPNTKQSPHVKVIKRLDTIFAPHVWSWGAKWMLARLLHHPAYVWTFPWLVTGLCSVMGCATLILEMLRYLQRTAPFPSPFMCLQLLVVDRPLVIRHLQQPLD